MKKPPQMRPYRAVKGKTTWYRMTSYEVQYVLPVDNPEKKVSITRRKGHMIFEVPINYPDAHNLTLMDLIAAAELSGLFTVSTGLNNKRLTTKKDSSKTGADA